MSTNDETKMKNAELTCHECGHGIDQHNRHFGCDVSDLDGRSICACEQSPSDIALAAVQNAWREAAQLAYDAAKEAGASKEVLYVIEPAQQSAFSLLAFPPPPSRNRKRSDKPKYIETSLEEVEQS